MEEELIKRTMPNDPEAEQAVIGSMIMDREAVTAAMGILERDDFYQQQYGILFETIIELYNSGAAVDMVTIQDRLRQKKVPPQISSLDYMDNLLASVTTSTRVSDYAWIVKEKSTLRKLIRASESIAETCYQDKDKLDDILEDTEKQVFSLLQSSKRADFVPIGTLVMEEVDRIDRAGKLHGDVTGLPTGFKDLDYLLSGLQPSDLVMIAARPSMGKTALALNIAQYVAFHEEEAVAIFSLEMDRGQLVSRLLSMEARVDSQRIRTGKLSVDDWQNVVEASDTIGKSKLIIDDTPGISVSELRSKCRKYKLEHDIKLIVLDYLQLMSGTSRRPDSRQQEISDISRSLKQIARELDVPVLALSQLSRQVEQRPEHRPMLSDLRESGAIEQDADVVMFIYRDDYYNKDSDRKGIAEVTIAKHRNGPTGSVDLIWLPQYTKFVSSERDSQ